MREDDLEFVDVYIEDERMKGMNGRGGVRTRELMNEEMSDGVGIVQGQVMNADALVLES